ncbi:hypothetical protein DAPPUDRAFT_249245 [Daphnia pulex]|uniref:Uncharacterized protein n=1 Tax=Daphnia pulex TaxID=6669 RepID=E9GW84_DAPPU|nr:hypothetical protein DAPPUDRAFT_249245 [Daphnia pulex]|eukprot:EFX76304.1 hypothetical protein DAPPUDRAFT_249245 [Daphnia pulex]
MELYEPARRKSHLHKLAVREKECLERSVCSSYLASIPGERIEMKSQHATTTTKLIGRDTGQRRTGKQRTRTTNSSQAKEEEGELLGEPSYFISTRPPVLMSCDDELSNHYRSQTSGSHNDKEANGKIQKDNGVGFLEGIGH